MSHVQMSHVTGIHESCPMYRRVMSNVSVILRYISSLLHALSHVACANESRHMCRRVMSYVWTSHVVYTKNESCHKYEQVTSHVSILLRDIQGGVASEDALSL